MRFAEVDAADDDEDSAEVCLEWRDDDDETGALTMSDDTVVTIRRPNDEPDTNPED